MANCFTSGHPKSCHWHWNSVAIKSVRNLDVHLHSTPRMQIHVAKVTQTYFYQPRRPAADSKTAQSWCHRQDRSSFCADMIGLWQCSTRWTVVLNPCTAAAHYQCRYVAGVRPSAEEPHHGHHHRVALAADLHADSLQAVSVHSSDIKCQSPSYIAKLLHPAAEQLTRHSSLWWANINNLFVPYFTPGFYQNYISSLYCFWVQQDTGKTVKNFPTCI